MEHFWGEIDDAVLQCLAVGDATPAEIGRHLGISEAAAASILAMLVTEGRVRICRVSVRDLLPQRAGAGVKTRSPRPGSEPSTTARGTAPPSGPGAVPHPCGR
jgi:hypothetical protein